MKRRRQRINKYTLTAADTFKERLKRSNPSPLERIAKVAELFDTDISNVVSAMRHKHPAGFYENNTTINPNKLLNLIRSDENEDRT